MKNYPKVTFGMVNCNRLFYLKSCLQSLIECTQDYPNKEIIVIDNASQESGTKEYLNSIESDLVKVYEPLFVIALKMIHFGSIQWHTEKITLN